MHLIIKNLKNGGGNSGRWKTIDDVETLRDVFDYYSGKSVAFKEKNVYYQINPCQYKGTKAGKNDVINNTAIPIDIDGMDRSDIDSLEEDILDFFQKMGITDFITINSGNGLHALISIGTLASNWLEKNKQAIIDTIYSPISSIAKEYGGNIDKKVLESSRILRVPNTINEKEKKGTAECRIITDRWIGESNKSIVDMIGKTTSSKVMEQHNVSFMEIVTAFESIGAEFSHYSGYAFIKHPERGSKKTLSLYKDAKYFYSFSDKDDFPFIQMSDVWNMYGSGKPFPFSQFDSSNVHKIIKDRMGFDFRYATKSSNQYVIVVADKNKAGRTITSNMSKSVFTTYFKTKKIKQYFDKNGIQEITAEEAFIEVVDSLPLSKFDAEPIDDEKNKIISKWIGLGTMVFDAPSSEIENRTLKKNLLNIIRENDDDTLEKLLISVGETSDGVGKCCIKYSSVRAMFGQKSDYFAESEMEFKSIIKWLGLETSDEGGLLCFFDNKSLSFTKKDLNILT